MGKTPKEILAEYEYNEINQLINKKVGDNLQKIEYQYNIRNWLSGINLNSSGNIDNTKLFSYKIKYNNPLNNALKKFNGNISEIDWVYQGEISQRYEYSYDELNRLKLANYKSIGQTTTTDSKFYNEQLSYDLNGNILNLKRNARPMYGQTAVLVDNLDYTYEGNRLTKIFDNTQNTSGYPAVMISQSISYDQNGNMTTMPDKGITNISYNFLNLPKQITQNGNITNHIYRADGTKLKKTYTFTNSTGTSVINTEYLDGFQYSTPNTEPLRLALEQQDEETVNAVTAGEEEAFSPLEDRQIADLVVDPGEPTQDQNNVYLSFFPTAEGYYDYENFRYIYQVKDHLGNVRVSYIKDDINGIKIMDKNDYYPFGMVFLKDQNITPVYDPLAIPYNYKYNGKELQETGMYDYGARFYMPDIARWGVVDPLAEQYRRFSPYNYVVNNPVRNIDPDGMGIESMVGMKLSDRAVMPPDWVRNNDTQDLQYVETAKNQETSPENTTYVGETHSENGLNYAADGNVYDSTGTVVENGKMGEIEEVTITAAKPIGGMAVQGSLNWAIGGGLNLAFGYVQDSGGDYSFYFSIGGNLGLGAGLSLDFIPITATGSNKDFNVGDFAGYSNSYTVGLGNVSGSYGGSNNAIINNPSQNFNPSNWGKGKQGYNTQGGSYGIGAKAGFMWTRTNTTLIGR